MSTDVAIPDSTGDIDHSGLSYEELLAFETFRIAGLTLLRKAELIGVPHIITQVTYWMPPKNQMGMASVEATIASEQYLKRAIERSWIPNVTDLNQLKLDPNERVVYNDGSTGIRRQLTMLFQHCGMLNVGHEENETDARFDTPWPEWDSFCEYRTQSAEIGNVPSFSRTPDGRPLVIRVDRGLSVSDYTNDYGDGETYYLR